MSVHGRLGYIFLFLAFWLLPFLLELECAMQLAHKNVGNIISLCRKKNLVTKLRVAGFKKRDFNYKRLSQPNRWKFETLFTSGTNFRGAAWIFCSAKSYGIWLMLHSMEYGFSNDPWQLAQCPNLCCQTLWY